MPFRSKGAVSGYFREAGTIHAHIDAGGKNLIHKVEAIARKLDLEGLKGKSSEIVDSFASSHRNHEDFQQTYANHAPGTKEEDRFSVFSTTKFKNENPKVVAT